MASPIGSTSNTGGNTNLPKQADAFENLKVEDFIKLMITEMQNQDPLNPMDNSQMLEQFSQMQSIQSTKSLTSTLGTMSLEMSLASGGSLIGRGIVGLTEKGEQVLGVVDSISITDGKTYANVTDGEEIPTLKTLPLSNIRQIL